MATPQPKHVIREIEFLGRKVPIVMQAAGGASPLLSIGAAASRARAGKKRQRAPKGAAQRPLCAATPWRLARCGVGAAARCSVCSAAIRARP